MNSAEMISLASRTPPTRDGVSALAARVVPLPTEAVRAAIDSAFAAGDFAAALALLLAEVEAGRKVDIRQVVAVAPFADGLEEFAVLVGGAEGRIVDALLDLIDSHRYDSVGNALALLLVAQRLGKRKPPPRMVAALRRAARMPQNEDEVLLLGLTALRIPDPHVAWLCESWMTLARARDGVSTEQFYVDVQAGPPSRVLPERAAPVEETGLPVQRAEPKVGRNDPCPCGSGRKFKKCCGAETSTATNYAPVPQQLRPERLAELRPHQLAALDFTTLTPAQLFEAARCLSEVHLWEPVRRAIQAIEENSGATPEDIQVCRIEAYHAACHAGALEVANELREVLESKHELDPIHGLAFDLARPTVATVRRIEAAALEVVAHPEDVHAPFAFVQVLMRRLPALGILAARGILTGRSAEEAQRVMDAVEWARDGLLLPPEDPGWALYDLLQREAVQGAPPTPDEELAAEAEALRSRSEEAAAKAATMERRMREVEAELRDARARAAAAASASPVSPAEAEAVQRLRAKVSEYEGQIAEGNRERRQLRSQLAEVSGRLARAASGTPPRGETETPVDDPEEQEASRPERLPVLIPAFARPAEEGLRGLPGPLAREALRTVASLAGGEASVWARAKRLRRLADVWSARVGIHHRLLFRIDADRGMLAVADLIHRKDLEATLQRWR